MTSSLVDRLIVNPAVDPTIRAILPHAYVVTSDNVADYVSLSKESSHKSYYDLFQGVGAMTPPFESMFIQWRVPDAATSEIGVWLARQKTDDGWDVGCLFYLSRGIQWAMTQFTVAADGSVDVERVIENASVPATITARGLDMDGLSLLVIDSLLVVFMTLAFLNTSNVHTEAIEPRASENKKRTKHGKLPLMRYHVLKIKPFGRRYDSAETAGDGGKRALHIRRGHFRTYTDAAPLFGHFVGTVWVDQHTAGGDVERVVTKDYEMDLEGRGS